MNNVDWGLGALGILLVVIIFVLIAGGCSDALVNMEHSGVCKYLGYDHAYITWHKFPEGIGDYSVECVKYIPLEINLNKEK